MGYTGPTKCPAGMYCHYFNAWYSQCFPGSGSVQSTTSAPTPVDSSAAARTTLSTTITARS